MKMFCAILITAAALFAGDPQEKKATPPKTVDGSKPIAIPAGAIQSPDGDFHYTDPQGKKWIYRRTPFGVARLDEAAEEQSKVPQVDKSAGIKATVDGDKVRFERPGPFGTWKWEKKTSELDETEKAALARSRAEDATPKQE
jgi:hypothetical protein